MITRSITRPVTSPIARAVNAAFAVWNPRALFALSDPGVFLDHSDMATLYQDSAGTTPVTAAVQPEGLVLDKRLGLIRSNELIVNPGFDTDANWTKGAEWSISGGKLACVSAALNSNTFQVGAVSAGKFYEITYKVDSVSSGGIRILLQGGGAGGTGPLVTSPGIYKTILTAASTGGVFIYSGVSGTTASVDSVSVRELPGNHAIQSTAAARGLWRSGPARIDYDLVDDSLGITFPASLGAACTVARSIPGVGAQILTAQTIGTSFTDAVDNCALIIINRALTAAETTNMTNWLNWRAGV